MKITASDSIELIKISGIALGAFLFWRYGRAYLTPLVTGIEKTAAAAGETWSDVAAWFGGYEPVEFTEPRFFLSEQYVLSDGKLDLNWKEALIRANADIEPLFDILLDVKGRLKPQYEHLINGEVSAETLANASGVNIAILTEAA